MSEQDVYRTREWFHSLEWQHRWIQFMVGWWAGHYGVPRSVVDYGAGDGWWPHCFKLIGMEHTRAYAVELDAVAREFIPTDVEFIESDLRRPMEISQRLDLVICLEVAEHMTRIEAHNGLLPTLVASMGNVLLFSAAQPGQLGTGHINLQPQSYWIKAFEDHAYIKLSNERTAAVRQAFERIVPEGLAFLPRNLLVFARI